VVKGVQFLDIRDAGDPVEIARRYDEQGADEITFLDITASHEGRDTMVHTVEKMASQVFIPLTVGGGITRIEQVQRLLRAGADKVSVNTAAYTRPELVSEIARRHGAQCVVASIDVRAQDGGWTCFSHAGKQATGREVVAWARELEDRGAGEILITSIERDGTMQGYDLPLIETLVRAVNIPVIASGGAGNYQHMVEAVTQADMSAVAAASMFHFTEQTPAGAKSALAAAGVPVRQTFVPL